MRKHVLSEMEKFIQQGKKHRTWRKVVSVLACGVVFCTTYALILPAITQENDTTCAFEEHRHDANCYTSTIIEKLVCDEPEISYHEHTDACYQIVEEASAVTYDDSRLNENDPSGKDSSLIIEESESEQDRAADAGEVQDQSSLETVENVLNEETFETTIETNGEPQRILICEQPEEKIHEHTENCYEKSESEAILNCDKQEHIHGLACYADLTADVETAEVWEKTFADVELKGVWTDDVIAIAKTQLGYVESSKNYIVESKKEADGTIEETAKGYTRYGAWYGNAYGDWCAMFASFCLDYAGVEGMPLEAYCPTWIEKLFAEDVNLYHTTGAYIPETGNLVFFDWDADGESDHVGIVTAVNSNTEDGVMQIETIEGNSNNRVAAQTYPMTDETIMGFAALPYQLSEEEWAEVDRVIAMINEMPSANEIDAKVEEFYEAEDEDGEIAYLEKTYQQVSKVYSYYNLLSERQKVAVTNADKLLELEYIWSQATLEVTYDASARTDDLTAVSGDGISFALFDYSKYINKVSSADSAEWRAIQKYFNFRDSKITDGSYTDNSQNKEHDIDGFTKTHATVERKLDSNKNPILDLTRNADGSARSDPNVSKEVRSLAYLFSDQGDHAVKAYNPSNTILQKDGNHYWYDSKNNAVDYDINNGVFRIRSYAERNDTTAGYSGYSDFLPFTYTGGVVAGTNASTGVDYHVEYAGVNYWYGMTMDINFFQSKDGQINGEDMVFKFSGDDDVWVFVDDVLVLDLGGTHGTATGSINFSTGEVVQYLSWNGGSADNTSGSAPTSFPTTIRECFDAAGVTPKGGWSEDGTTLADYTEHTLKFFYMERGGAVANCKLDFLLPTLPDKSLTVTKDLVADGNDEVKEFLSDTLLYKFRVVKTNEEGEATEDLFITPGMTYTILDEGTSAGTGIVGADGTFSLKPGQSAQFTDMLVKGGGAVNYVVQEIIPETLSGQYAGIEYEVSGAENSVKTENGVTSSFITYSTKVLSAESTQTVVYRNKVDTNNLSVLKLTKALAPSASFENGKVFRIQVKLGEELLPVGSKYKYEDGEIKTVTEPGVVELEIGQTATLVEGILSGTEYEITELGVESGGFTPSYSGVLTANGKASDIVCSANGVSGEFLLNSEVHITVTNASYDFAGQIPIYKQALDNSATATFQFVLEQVEQSADGSWKPMVTLPGTSITVADDREYAGVVTIGYDTNVQGKFYYRITEQRGTDSYIYDDSFYIVEVNVVSGGEDGKGLAQITQILKNGTEVVEKVLFTNRRTTDLIVTKEVVGTMGSGEFEFEAAVMLNGQPFNLPPSVSDTEYTVSGNKVYFNIGHGEAIAIKGIPFGAVVTVTETLHDGFASYYRVESVDIENVPGDTATVNFASATQTVHFVNVVGFELPETGGTHVQWYTMGGLLLMIAAILLLYIYKSKDRREGRPS